ncbi:MAG: exonuclease domain-containing protein [Atopobiaceae bacterium]|nr:exonuclease domain-containing protein [Atopobiaceae bacterium]
MSAYACNVVIDLEFTHVPRQLRSDGIKYEIIEIGAVKLAADGSVAGEFSHMVKPTIARGVSGAVHRITGIGDEDLTCARPLAEVLEALRVWIGPAKARMVTWSECDLKQITCECAAKGIDVELPGRWLDIQRLFPRLMGMERNRRVALGDAADWCGIANDKANAHRALYDAQITAELFRLMASGECAAHRARVKAELDKGRGASACSASIGERCGGLEELLASLRAQEAA